MIFCKIKLTFKRLPWQGETKISYQVASLKKKVSSSFHNMNQYPIASASYQQNTRSRLHRDACHQLMGMLCFLLGDSDHLRLQWLSQTQPLINCYSFLRPSALKFCSDHGDSQIECKHSYAFRYMFSSSSPADLSQAWFFILLVKWRHVVRGIGISRSF